MKGLKKLALTTAVLAASTGAFAMEAMQDADLSSTTGQAGLTILTSGVNVTASAIRYYDADGTTGAVAALGIPGAPSFPAVPGPCAGLDPATCTNNFANTTGGSVNINGFSLTANQILTTIDVGSNGSTATATTGLLIGSQVSNLNVNLGAISFDNGTELNGINLGAGPIGRAGNNGATYTAGVLTSGNDIGGIAITGLTIPNSAMLITAGAPQLTGGGASSGLTITSLIPISDLALTVNYYSTTTETFTPGTGDSVGGNFTHVGAHAANSGLISLPIDLLGVLQGPTEIAAGAAGGGYGTTNTQGLEILMTGTVISALDIGGHDLGHAGITIAGTNAGSVGILGLTIGSSQLNITGH